MSEASRATYAKKREYILNQKKLYRKTPNGQLVERKHRERRNLVFGYNPINTWFERSAYHHLNLEIEGIIDRDLGLYIPNEVHRSQYHNATTMKGMREMNKIALLWLCEQSIIQNPLK